MVISWLGEYNIRMNFSIKYLTTGKNKNEELSFFSLPVNIYTSFSSFYFWQREANDTVIGMSKIALDFDSVSMGSGFSFQFESATC